MKTPHTKHQKKHQKKHQQKPIPSIMKNQSKLKLTTEFNLQDFNTQSPAANAPIFSY